MSSRIASGLVDACGRITVLPSRETRNTQKFHPRKGASAPPADTPSPTQQSLLLAALVGAYANHFLARTMALKQARRMVSELIAKVAA